MCPPCLRTPVHHVPGPPTSPLKGEELAKAVPLGPGTSCFWIGGLSPSVSIKDAKEAKDANNVGILEYAPENISGRKRRPRPAPVPHARSRPSSSRDQESPDGQRARAGASFPCAPSVLPVLPVCQRFLRGRTGPDRHRTAHQGRPRSRARAPTTPRAPTVRNGARSQGQRRQLRQGVGGYRYEPPNTPRPPTDCIWRSWSKAGAAWPREGSQQSKSANYPKSANVSHMALLLKVGALGPDSGWRPWTLSPVRSP